MTMHTMIVCQQTTMVHFLRVLKHCRACMSQFRQNSISAAGRPLFLQVLKEDHGDRLALVDNLGQHTYTHLIQRSTSLSQHILTHARRDPVSSKKDSGIILNEERVAFLCPNNASYVVSQWGTWMSGGMAVPLCKVHPSEELEYVISDSDCSLVISTLGYADKISPIAKKLQINHIILDERYICSNNEMDVKGNTEIDNTINLNDGHIVENEEEVKNIFLDSAQDWKNIEGNEFQILEQKWSQVRWKQRNAMLVYTSGTTGRPKGVVSTFGNIQAQTTSLLDSWAWSPRDVILHVLPLHHVHGVINVLACPLWCGATCVMLPSFDPEQVWEHLLSDDHPRVNVFMAVPTIYAKLIEYYNERFTTPKVQAFLKATCKEKIRLMVSGSAALPQPIMKRWEDITGHTLLERYGMTELGMVLSNPLEGPRVPGSVGNPLPTVDVRITSSDGKILVRGNSIKSHVKDGYRGEAGQLEVKGPSVFKEYWRRPDATEESFKDDWFQTGDTVKYENGIYSILGRTSVDIIKSGGYKISALDVERRLLAHPAIAECVVVGLPDVTWGQRVAAVVVLRVRQHLDIRELRDWAKEKMPPYIIPTELKVLPEIPKNAMGKVNKKTILKEVFETEK